MYDIIGDIHGEDLKLEGLLRHLGYVSAGRGYKAPQGRQAVFLGDLVDRGGGAAPGLGNRPSHGG